MVLVIVFWFISGLLWPPLFAIRAKRHQFKQLLGHPVIRAGDPKGLELESRDTIYRYSKGRFAYEDREKRKRQMPSAIDGLLWSLGDSNCRDVRSELRQDGATRTTAPPVD